MTATKILSRYANYWMQEMPGIDEITLSNNLYLHVVGKETILIKRLGSERAIINDRVSNKKYKKYNEKAKLIFGILRYIPNDIKKIILNLITPNYIKYYIALGKYGFAKTYVRHINYSYKNEYDKYFIEAYFQNKI